MKFSILLGALLLSAKPSLAEFVPSVSKATWRGGNGKLRSGAMVSWHSLDEENGQLALAFLIPSKDNKVIDGIRQWNIGRVNCRDGSWRAEYFYDNSQKYNLKESQSKSIAVLKEFCQKHKQSYKKSVYYNQ